MRHHFKRLGKVFARVADSKTMLAEKICSRNVLYLILQNSWRNSDYHEAFASQRFA
jgi:hypothetical protein